MRFRMLCALGVLLAMILTTEATFPSHYKSGGGSVADRMREALEKLKKAAEEKKKSFPLTSGHKSHGDDDDSSNSKGYDDSDDDDDDSNGHNYGNSKSHGDDGSSSKSKDKDSKDNDSKSKDSKSKDKDSKSQDHGSNSKDSDSKDGNSKSKDKDSKSKDKDSKSKDKDSNSKDKDSKDKDSKSKDKDSKSNDKDSKDKDSKSKDKDSKSKDKDSKDKDSKSKDKDSKSKDKDSEDKDSKSKDKDSKSKDKDSKSKDKDSEDKDSKDKDSKSKDKDSKSKDKDSKSKDKDSKSKDKDSKSKDKDSKSKDKDSKSKDKDSKSKDDSSESEDGSSKSTDKDHDDSSSSSDSFEDGDKCDGKTKDLKCESWDYKDAACKVYGDKIIGAKLIKQESNTKCEKNKNWGYKDTYVWVKKGCRAVFKLCLEGHGSKSKDDSSDSKGESSGSKDDSSKSSDGDDSSSSTDSSEDDDKCDGKTKDLKCESWDYKDAACKVYGDKIVGAKLIKQESNTKCEKNKNWGYKDTYVWVKKGCRAIFKLCLEGENKCDGKIKDMKCESWDFKYKTCQCDDGPIRGAILLKQESKIPCVKGINWGYKDGYLYVLKGCRAVFKVCVEEEKKCEGMIKDLKCESWDWKDAMCPVNDGIIKGVKLYKQESKVACQKDVNWGFKDNFVFVKKGCRALFKVCVEGEKKCDGQIKDLKCESWDYKPATCTSNNGPIKGIQLYKQESRTECKQNINWGYKDSHIWVKDGCRAVFKICIDEKKCDGQIKDLKCESWDYKPATCTSNNGPIKGIQLYKQESKTECKQNINWGYKDSHIWVKDGCRAVFKICVDEEKKCDGQIKDIKCESSNYKPASCTNNNGPIKGIQLYKQESKTECKQNINWGYKDSHIWVKDGCRAIFKICVDEKKCDGRMKDVKCESWDYKDATCDVNDGSITDVQLYKQESKTECKKDINWGYKDNYIFVKSGCRAVFKVCVGDVDGGWSNWSEYSACTKTCGSGTRKRTRTCSNPTPSTYGANCVGNSEEVSSCNTQPCPVDGKWTTWSNYEPCSKSCGSGTQSRTRSCTNPAPANGGADCDGDDKEERTCNTNACPVDGGWSDWTSYGSCSKSCGPGTQSRSRTCSNPQPTNGGKDCVGDDTDERSCNLTPCPVDGGWSDWSSYGSCSKTYGSGTQSRHRTCSNPAPANGGQNCEGEDMQEQTCNTDPCPVNGQWATWMEYGPCSKTCGTGKQSRSRTCSNPAPANGGKDCIGLPTDERSCNTEPCPVEEECLGSKVNKTCQSWDYKHDQCNFNLGIQSIKGVRLAKLLSNTMCKKGENWGFDATSIWVDKGCRAVFELCLGVDGGWSPWSPYGACSQSCDTGSQIRSRTCSNPTPSANGVDCVGTSYEEMSCNTQPCPVDGGWSNWGNYETCSLTCGSGVQTRYRTCDNPAPANGGQDCVGSDEDTRSCNDNPCPVDGDWSGWSDYDTCTVTCGGGLQTRTRTCTDPAPAYGGADCVGSDQEQRGCNPQNCPVDGSWSDWSEYDMCSDSCGGGTKTRTRSCSNPQPAYGGMDCVGDSEEIAACNEQPCPVDGGWSDWSGYTGCSKSCGSGTKSRSRTCSNPQPQFGGEACVGNPDEVVSCNTNPCPVNGGWSDWSSFGSCSHTCGTGKQFRSRSCTNPEPMYGGNDCVGEATDEQACNTDPCPVDGGWTPWSDYGSCSKTCGTGTQSRQRSCTNPEPMYGGADCDGPDSEDRDCNTQACPVDGGWSDWSQYGGCSKTCGTGKQSRTRSCDNPEPVNNGAPCVGDSMEEISCNPEPCPDEEECTGETVERKCESWDFKYADCTDLKLGSKTIKGVRVAKQESSTSCKYNKNWGFNATAIYVDKGCRAVFELCLGVDGGWSEWSPYGSCSKTCGAGTQIRKRTCTNPKPSVNGADCVGKDEEMRSCNTKPCPVDGKWSDWSSYSTCSASCGTGSQSRTRSCSNPAPANGGKPCEGDSTEDQDCNKQPCPVNGNWGEWADYGACSVSCGGGYQKRSRQCDNPEPQWGGADCVGTGFEVQSCNTHDCPVDGVWTPWAQYRVCSKTCGGGVRTRERSCDNPAPANGGQECSGDSEETVSCNNQACPIDGEWSEWSKYSTCTVSCGSGIQTRTRTCTNPSPQFGGKPCVGNAEEEMSCNTDPCPVDGQWSEWSSYGVCSVSCGPGTQSRSRTCSNPQPANGGKDCVGDDTDERSCNLKPCPVNGGWSDWSAYGSCSVTCGSGVRVRDRGCTNPSPAYGGNDCVGTASEEADCYPGPCPIDGHWSPWTEYGACSKTCGTGKKSRSRTCTNPEPEHGGAQCVGMAYEDTSCNTQPCPVEEECDGKAVIKQCASVDLQYASCNFSLNKQTIKGVRLDTQLSDTPCVQDDNWGFDSTSVWVDNGCRAKFELCLGVDGGWSSWSKYGKCSKSCGTGVQSRTRKCSNPAPTANGADCVGADTEEQSCNEQLCPINGAWTEWTEYGSCSVSCGRGIQSRERTCSNPAPTNGGRECPGKGDQEKSCNTNPCPVDGNWGDWSDYSRCTESCGGGVQTRKRKCNNPRPANDGTDCVGNDEEEQSCNTQPCPVNGGWTEWSDYGSCSVSCDGGKQVRTRTCTNPTPMYGGRECNGKGEQEKSCNNQKCPVDGNWSEWSEYTPCTKSCGSGTKFRLRTCTDPKPRLGGKDCVGSMRDEVSCNTEPCPVDGGWSSWSSYGTCSKTCGGGVQSRERTCSNPQPMGGGADCPGSDSDSRPCNTEPCPSNNVDGNWTPWSGYGTCSKTCGGGKQSRSRSCTNPAPSGSGADCDGPAEESRSCNNSPCPSGNDTMRPPYKKPEVCHIKEPCCEQGELKVILGSKGIKIKKRMQGKLNGVKVGKFGKPKKQPCSQSVLVSVDFERIDDNACFGCLQAPYCGRRMLKIDLELSNAGRKGWLFNVGDSQSNNGHRGDSNHQKNDAEIQGLYPNITVFPSDKCLTVPQLMHIIDGCINTVQHVTLYISNEHVRITNSDGLDYYVCSSCLFALNGQDDSGPLGGQNERVFVGLNRVVSGLSRTGYGVCSATFSWACPWCD